MLLNLAVVLVAIGLIYVVQTRIDLEPRPRLIATLAIAVSVLVWLIIGAAPK